MNSAHEKSELRDSYCAQEIQILRPHASITNGMTEIKKNSISTYSYSRNFPIWIVIHDMRNVLQIGFLGALLPSLSDSAWVVTAIWAGLGSHLAQSRGWRTRQF